MNPKLKTLHPRTMKAPNLKAEKEGPSEPENEDLSE